MLHWRASVSLVQKTYLVYIPWHVYHNHACNSMQSSKVRCARSKCLPCWFERTSETRDWWKKLGQFIIQGKEECYIEELPYHSFRRPILDDVNLPSFFPLASGFRSPSNQHGRHFDLAHLTLEDCTVLHGCDKHATECKPNKSSERRDWLN